MITPPVKISECFLLKTLVSLIRKNGFVKKENDNLRKIYKKIRILHELDMHDRILIYDYIFQLLFEKTDCVIVVLIFKIFT